MTSVTGKCSSEVLGLAVPANLVPGIHPDRSINDFSATQSIMTMTASTRLTEHHSYELPSGAIAGIVVACIIGSFVLFLLGCYRCCCTAPRRSSWNDEDQTHEIDSGQTHGVDQVKEDIEMAGQRVEGAPDEGVLQAHSGMERLSEMERVWIGVDMRKNSDPPPKYTS